jgi:hypothetical protein
LVDSFHICQIDITILSKLSILFILFFVEILRQTSLYLKLVDEIYSIEHKYHI